MYYTITESKGRNGVSGDFRTKMALSRQQAEKRRGEGDGDNGTNSSKDETPEETRSRLLKSTDAKEIYENRHLLTTNELNERINRIDTEQRLKSKIADEHAKTGADYLNKKMKGTAETVTNAKNLFKSVDEAYATVAKSAIGKTLAKKLGLEPPKKEFDLDEFWKNRNKKTTQEIVDANRRLTAEESIRQKMAGRDKDKKQARKKTKNESRKRGNVKCLYRTRQPPNITENFAKQLCRAEHRLTARSKWK